MNNTLKSLQEKITHATDVFEGAVKKEQYKCSHDKIGELPYKSDKWLGSTPPIRVCFNCGMSEEGWGCGYIVLINKGVEVSEKEFYSLRAGLFIRDIHKGPLIRGEITIDELIMNGDIPQEMKERERER